MMYDSAISRRHRNRMLRSAGCAPEFLRDSKSVAVFKVVSGEVKKETELLLNYPLAFDEGSAHNRNETVPNDADEGDRDDLHAEEGSLKQLNTAQTD